MDAGGDVSRRSATLKRHLTAACEVLCCQSLAKAVGTAKDRGDAQTNMQLPSRKKVEKARLPAPCVTL